MRRVHTNGHQWQAAPELAELSDGEVGGFRVGGVTALVCRIGGDIYAYRDRCPSCLATLAGARLRGAVLQCPSCGAGFDAVHAGAGVGGDSHLDPIPVLVRDGVLSMAVPEEVA
jgi:nitrite reductase/ring-hydroxylating ferredoxin subunit